MKAISIKQPWASQIISGQKAEEYRSWATRYRGEILICASKSPQIEGLPSGQICGIATIANVVETDSGFAWIMTNPRAVEHVPCRGMPGIFEIPDSEGKEEEHAEETC
jgi:hypothetical protein